MDKPIVSICVPIYGVEKYIERCVVSLMEQTYESLEYIFVNDCTQDNSMEKLHFVLNRYPNRMSQVRIIQHEINKGLGGVRNTAVAVANGEFIVHVDSDDYVTKNAIEKLMYIQMKNNADIVFPDAFLMHKSYNEYLHNEPIEDTLEYAKRLLRHQTLGCIWGRLIRRSLYIDNNIQVEEGTNMGEDLQVIPLLCYYSKRIGFLEEPIYYYESTSENSYTNTYSLAKLQQDWRSMDIARQFFIDKGMVNVAKEAELKNIATHLVYSSYLSNIDYCYQEAVRRLQTIDKKYWHTQPIQIRIIFMLSGCRAIMNMYVKFAKAVKVLITKMQNQLNVRYR